MSFDGVGTLVRIEGKMTGESYVDILEQNVEQSALKLSLGRRFIFQQDNDPKVSMKSLPIYGLFRNLGLFTDAQAFHLQNRRRNLKPHD